MNVEHLKDKGTGIAVIFGAEKRIVDIESALNSAMTVKYETGAEKTVINKTAVYEDFFILSSGMAGEILQKFISYHVQTAIYGGCSKYAGKPLKDLVEVK